MKPSVAAALLLSLLSTALAPVAPASAESLLGAWHGSYRAHVFHPDGMASGEVTMTLVITEHDAEDGFLLGYHEWFLDEDHDGTPDVAGTTVREAREDLVGILDFDGRHIRLIETRDNGVFEGFLTGNGTLQLIYTEGHHDEATVFRVALRRDATTQRQTIEVRDAEAFAQNFCAAPRTGPRIFVLPVAAFSNGGEIACPHGVSTMRMAEPADDPGHILLTIDPPGDVPDSFDCDGKADIGMPMVAVNCMPANAESGDHRKP